MALGACCWNLVGSFHSDKYDHSTFRYLPLFINVLGIAGLLVAIFGKKIIHPTISFYFQAVAGFFAFFLSISETGLLVSTVKWVESVKQEQVLLVFIINNKLNNYFR